MARDGSGRAGLQGLGDPLTLLDGLFTHSPVPYAIFSRTGRCELVNPAYVAMFGVAPPPEYDVLHDEVAASTGLSGFVQRAFAGEVVRAPTVWYDPRRLVHVRGEQANRVAIACTFFPLKDEADEVAWVAVAYDDVTAELTAREAAETDRDRAQAALARLEAVQDELTARVREQERAARQQRFLSDSSRLLAESRDTAAALIAIANLAASSVATFCIIDLVDQDGRLRRAAGAHREPGLGARMAAAATFPAVLPEDNPWGQVLAAGRSVFLPAADEETWRRIATGPEHLRVIRTIAPRSLAFVPVVAASRVFGVVTIGTCEGDPPFDEDDLAMAEEVARRAGQALETTRLLEALAEAVRARDEFLSVASHELRTPLSAMQLQVHAFRRAGGPPRGDQLDRLQRQVDRMTSLVDRLLDVAQIRAGRLVLRLETHDLAELCAEGVARFRPLAENVGSELRFSTDGPLLVRIDADRIDQVITNLLSNALKFGGGRPIHVEVAARAGFAVVVVRDEGPGVEAEHQARIFDRFERLSSTSALSGLGLGLWISREIVEAHGGRIQVESAPGRGAAFTVEIPLEGD